MNDLKSIVYDISLLGEEIKSLRSELITIKNELPINRNNPLFNEFKNQCASMFVVDSFDNVLNTIEEGGNYCPMWTQCKTVFISSFDDLANHVRKGKISNEDIETIRENFKIMKNRSLDFNHCSQCFKHIETFFEQQIKILKKMGFNMNNYLKSLKIQELNVKQVSSLIGDSLSSPIRVLILKTLYIEEKSFTELSNITKLKAGNLLFHLAKLNDNGLICQHEERGNYYITLQGHNTMNFVIEIAETFDLGPNTITDNLHFD